MTYLISYMFDLLVSSSHNFSVKSSSVKEIHFCCLCGATLLLFIPNLRLNSTFAISVTWVKAHISVLIHLVDNQNFWQRILWSNGFPSFCTKLKSNIQFCTFHGLLVLLLNLDMVVLEWLCVCQPFCVCSLVC